MTCDEKLCQLHAKVLRERECSAQLQQLRRQVTELVEDEKKFKLFIKGKKKNIRKLRRPGVHAIAASLNGKRKKELAQERDEFNWAEEEYEKIWQQITYARKTIPELEQELSSVEGHGDEYRALFDKKFAFVRESGRPCNQQIDTINQSIAVLDYQIGRLNGIITSGKIVLDQVEEIASEFKHAEDLSMYDMTSGSFAFDFAKHKHIDKAQGKMEDLNRSLKRFNDQIRELSMYVENDMDLKFDSFLRLTDFLFDGVLSDWVALDRIRAFQYQVEEFRKKIEEVIDQLDTMRCRYIHEKHETMDEIAQLVIAEPWPPGTLPEESITK